MRDFSDLEAPALGGANLNFVHFAIAKLNKIGRKLSEMRTYMCSVRPISQPTVKKWIPNTF